MIPDRFQMGQVRGSWDFLQPRHGVKRNVVLKFPGAFASNDAVIDHMTTARFGRKLRQIRPRYLVGGGFTFRSEPEIDRGDTVMVKNQLLLRWWARISRISGG